MSEIHMDAEAAGLATDMNCGVWYVFKEGVHDAVMHGHSFDKWMPMRGHSLLHYYNAGYEFGLSLRQAQEGGQVSDY